MRYKALICDIDGTLTENKQDGFPTDKVADSVIKACKKLRVGVATGRSFEHALPIIKALRLNSPCIIANGAQIYDPVSDKFISEHFLSEGSVEKIHNAIRDLNVECIIQEKRKKQIFTNNYKYNNPLYVYIPPLSSSDDKKFLEGISSVHDVNIHKMIAWEKNKEDYEVTNITASKQHAILEVAEALEISTHEIIGIGDGYNDFPLMMACGLKVAMGNAVDDIKAIADYVAPTVDEDGVADVIEKFILPA